jgi:hypothetical protein
VPRPTAARRGCSGACARARSHARGEGLRFAWGATSARGCSWERGRQDALAVGTQPARVARAGAGPGRAAGEGLTCHNCHEAHTSNTAALTRTELDCGASLCMKMAYRRTDGGECGNCHGDKIGYRDSRAKRLAAGCRGRGGFPTV